MDIDPTKHYTQARIFPLKFKKKAAQEYRPWEKYDMMKEYR